MRTADQIAAQSFTPLALRARADVQMVEQRAGHGRRWAVKDPVSLRYYHLGETEMFLFRLLKRPRSYLELKERFEGAFPPQRISVEQIQEFCARLHAHHLLVSDGAGQAAVLRQRRDQRRRESFINVAFGLLAIRLPGMNAEPSLRPLAWLGNALFSGPFALAASLMLAVANVLLFGRAGEFVRELPTLQTLAQPHVFAYFLLTMLMVKITHELGHALACRRFGGECHEVGILLLTFMPCLYCDVSDSWMFASRWRRIVVALAGIYVELLVAAVAAILWCLSEPGPLHTISLYVVIACTVSTVLVNGNPLLRYDGYYVLSDLAGVPNLDEQSRRALWSPLLRWITQRNGPDDPLDGGRLWLALYAAAAVTYRLVVLGVILWLIHYVLVENHLRPLADVLAGTVLCGMIFHALRSAYRSIAPLPAWRAGGTLWRSAVLAGLFLGGALVVLNHRLEQRAEVTIQLEAIGAVPVFSPLSGQLVDAVPYGESVQPGQRLAQLRDQDMQLHLEGLTGRVQEVDARLETLSIRAQQFPALFAEIATMRTVHADLRRQQTTLRNEEQRLAIRAPIDGVVLRPPAAYGCPRPDSIELHPYAGAPLDLSNRGSYLNKGELICLVGQPHNLQAVARVDAADVGLITIGDLVRLRLNQNPSQTIQGNVTEIGLSELQTSGRQSGNTPAVGARPAVLSDGFSPAQYYVRMKLDRHPAWVRHGSGGVARIVTGHQTVAQMIQRFCYRVFRFHW
jgi:putative peptide zinc metalloprotease protein